MYTVSPEPATGKLLTRKRVLWYLYRDLQVYQAYVVSHVADVEVGMPMTHLTSSRGQ